MTAHLNRVILYVQDVERLSDFYRQAFAFPLVQHIAGEWAVLQAGSCELALHRVGVAHRVADAGTWRASSNAKLVLATEEPIEAARARLVGLGVAMGPIKSYPGLTGPLCDGSDPEGNVFQLAQMQPASDQVVITR